jgi:predicted DNA-binding transcriptional regulator YafY
MAINKNAYLRYQVLDRCFRNPGRMYFIEDLIEACSTAMLELDQFSTGVKRRQLMMDFRFMESPQGWSIPLERISFGKRKFYRYTDLNFSINNQLLNEQDLNQVRSALSIFSRIKGIPHFEWMNEIIARLEQTLHLTPWQQDFISFESNEYLTGIEHLGVLFDAISFKKVILIDYKAFKSAQPESWEIHPYYLKQHNNRWFLFGHCSSANKILTLALDRILGIKETKIKYLENTSVDFSEYFEDIIGVSRPENISPIKIELRFTPSQAPYVLTKPLHGSQKKVSMDESGLVISVKVIPNHELEQLLLSFGDNVEVLSPGEFRVHISERLTAAVKQYHKPPSF